MQACLDTQVDSLIDRATDVNDYNYHSLVELCSTEHLRLNALRERVGLPKIGIDYWQPRVTQRIAEGLKRTGNRRHGYSQNEGNFVTQYHALRGYVVIIGTALERCPKDNSNSALLVVLGKTLDQARSVLVASDQFVELTEKKGLNTEEYSVFQNMKSQATKEFLRTTDTLFSPEKMQSSCVRALTPSGLEQSLAEYLVALNRVDESKLDQELKGALAKIKQSVAALLSTLRTT
jgi:hypothetical protein